MTHCGVLLDLINDINICINERYKSLKILYTINKLILKKLKIERKKLL